MSRLPSNLSDTDPVVEEVRYSLLRQASVAKRVALARALSQRVIQLARRAIRRAHPDLSDIEVAVLFVRQHYGAELADGLQRRLATTKP